jgi:uncharacterized protein YyaL (SSP411 family)
MFFFTDDSTPSIIPRMMDFIDKAYPSSNSVMTKALTYLSYLEGNEYYHDVVKQMINNIKDQMPGAGPYVAYWANMLFYELYHPVVVYVPTECLTAVYGMFTPNLLVFPDTGNHDTNNIPDNVLYEIDGDYSRLVEFARKNKKLKY